MVLRWDHSIKPQAQDPLLSTGRCVTELAIHCEASPASYPYTIEALAMEFVFLCLPAATHLFLSSSPYPTSFKHFLLQTLPPPSHSHSDGRFTVSHHRPALGPGELLSLQPLSNILVTEFREPCAELSLRQHFPSEAPLLLLVLEMISSVVFSFLSSASLPLCLFCIISSFSLSGQ